MSVLTVGLGSSVQPLQLLRLFAEKFATPT